MHNLTKELMYKVKGKFFNDESNSGPEELLVLVYGEEYTYLTQKNGDPVLYIFVNCDTENN